MVKASVMRTLFDNGKPSIFGGLLQIFFATQIIGGAKELVVLL